MIRGSKAGPILVAAALAAVALVAPGKRASASGVLTEPWWAIPGGGGAGVTGGAFQISGAAGVPAAGSLSGGAYSVSAGFWAAPDKGASTGAPVPGVPTRFAFAPIAPNPFASWAELTFDLPRRDHVRVEVYDVAGARLRTLVDESREAGRYVERWDGRDDSGRTLGAGVYFVRLNTAANTATRRVVRLD